MTTTGLEGLAYPQYEPPPGRYTQRVDEVLDYSIDWSNFLATNDTIINSTWTSGVGVTASSWPDTAAPAPAGNGALDANVNLIASLPNPLLAHLHLFITGHGALSATATTPNPNGLTLSEFAFTATNTTIWVSGGAAGYLYEVRNFIVTAGGRVAERTLWFTIKPPWRQVPVTWNVAAALSGHGS
jgi:hypothetical protein